MPATDATQPVSVTVEATIVRANGTIEPHGVVAEWHRNPLRRALAKARGRGRVSIDQEGAGPPVFRIAINDSNSVFQWRHTYTSLEQAQAELDQAKTEFPDARKVRIEEFATTGEGADEKGTWNEVKS